MGTALLTILWWIPDDNHAGFWWGNLQERPLGRPRHTWEDNIQMDLQEMGCGGMDWIVLAKNKDRWRALVTALTNLRIP